MGLLRRQPGIFCHGEIFNPATLQAKTAPQEWRIENQAELLALRAADPRAFLSRMSQIRFGCALVGFKMMASHNPQIMAQVLHDATMRKIVLSRQNLLAQYASDCAARESGTYGGTGEKPLVSFHEKAFGRFLESTRAFYERTEETLRMTGQEYFSLRLDQINEPGSVAALLKFIGSEVVTPIFHQPPENRATADVLARFRNPETALAFLERQKALHWRFEKERRHETAS